MTTLPVLATAFDAIDRSEINRRLSTGEAFDHSCNQTLANIESLAEQLKTQLGDRAQEFEDKIDALITADHKTPATQALVEMGILKHFGDNCTGFSVPSLLGAGISWPTIKPGEDVMCEAAALAGPPTLEPTDVEIAHIKCRLPEQPADPIEQVAPASSAAVVIAMLQDLAEGTDGTVPVRVVVDGKKVSVLRAEFVGGEILLKCE